MNNLTSEDGGGDPLTELLTREEAQDLAQSLAEHGSLAAAYLLLLHRFNNMSQVADHLRISLSYAYQRCAPADLAHAAHRPTLA